MLLVIGLLVTAATTASVKDAFATLAIIAAGVAALAYLIRRAWRAVHLLELLLAIEETLKGIDGRLDNLEAADEKASNEHTEVLGMLALLDTKVDRVERLSKRNGSRVIALARDLGVEYRDQNADADEDEDVDADLDAD